MKRVDQAGEDGSSARSLLDGVSAGVVNGQPSQADEVVRDLPGLLTRQKSPDNLEFPFWSLNSFLVPNNQFFVRNHFSVPPLDPKTWRLSVEGVVTKPLKITYDDLLKMPAHNMLALMECSGNGRVFLKTHQFGVQWELGAVGTAEWTGVRLSDLLDLAGVKDAATEVVLEGADRGEIADPSPESHGVIHYARSLPLIKARQPEVLLAYKMNGQALPPAHGYPVRAVVAGWYGMASVKWLTRIVVTDKPFHGFFQTFQYSIWKQESGLRSLAPVTDIPVKAAIARPMSGETIPAEEPYRVFGAAWAGEADVAKVEVSTDGGKMWDAAKLIGAATPYCWRFWEYQWMKPTAGKVTLMARATDSKRRVQPMERDNDLRDAVIYHVLPVEAEVM